MSPTDPAAEPQPRFEVSVSRNFNQWLSAQGVSLAVSTYQIGKLLLFGTNDVGRLSIFERTLGRCLGMCKTSNGFYLSSLYQLWRFENILSPSEVHEGYDRVYVPRVGFTTGDLDVHDIGLQANGRPVFVNTLFSCLSELSDTHSFRPLWTPPFISRLAAEDRCHLNGLAMRDGTPAYVSIVGRSDVADGWRDHRRDGGVIMDVQNNEIVCAGLSMPHSPRWHDGRLWALNSGAGELVEIDIQAGKHRVVAFCPGYLRGLDFHGNYAIVGLSKPRHNKTFSGLPLDEALTKRGASARCGICVIDLRTGDTTDWLHFDGLIEELYDVITLPDTRRPMALGFKTEEIQRMISIEQHSIHQTD